MREASVEELAHARRLLGVSDEDLEANRQGRLSARQARAARLEARLLGGIGLGVIAIGCVALVWRGWCGVGYGAAAIGALVLLVAGLLAREARNARAYVLDGRIGRAGVHELRIGGRRAHTLHSARLAQLLVGARVRAYVDAHGHLLALDPPLSRERASA
jgi:hypothetical protein